MGSTPVGWVSCLRTVILRGSGCCDSALQAPYRTSIHTSPQAISTTHSGADAHDIWIERTDVRHVLFAQGTGEGTQETSRTAVSYELPQLRGAELRHQGNILLGGRVQHASVCPSSGGNRWQMLGRECADLVRIGVGRRHDSNGGVLLACSPADRSKQEYRFRGFSRAHQADLDVSHAAACCSCCGQGSHSRYIGCVANSGAHRHAWWSELEHVPDHVWEIRP